MIWGKVIPSFRIVFIEAVLERSFIPVGYLFDFAYCVSGTCVCFILFCMSLNWQERPWRFDGDDCVHFVDEKQLELRMMVDILVFDPFEFENEVYLLGKLESTLQQK